MTAKERIGRFADWFWVILFFTSFAIFAIALLRFAPLGRETRLNPLHFLHLPMGAGDALLLRAGFASGIILLAYILLIVISLGIVGLQAAREYARANQARFFGWWNRPRLIAFSFLFVGYLVMLDSPSGFFESLSPELFGIGLTVLIIDALNQREQDQRLRQQLVRELGSGDNKLAKRAASELRAYGWLEDGSLRLAYLGSADLRECDFTRVHLPRVHFRKACLKKADFTRANLKQANFAGANLKKANLSQANLEKTSFWKANLEAASLREANLHEANLEEANLEGSQIARAQLQGVNAARANFKKATLSGSNLEKAKLEEADFEGATFRSVYIASKTAERDGDRRYTLDKDWAIEFSDVDLSGVNLRGAKNLTIGHLVKAESLEGAILPNGILFNEWVFRNLIYSLRGVINQYDIVLWGNYMIRHLKVDINASFSQEELLFITLYDLIKDVVINENTEQEIKNRLSFS